MRSSLPSQYIVAWEDAGIAEPPAACAHRLPEKFVSCLWFDPRWRPPVLRTLDGRAVTVHSPGRWNRQAGPDFQQAVLTFDDGARQRGDVEIHRFTSGWTAHRHHLDPRYNQVILHVCLWQDRATTGVIREDGHTVPQVILEPWLTRPLAAYSADIPLEEYPQKRVPFVGQCYTKLKACTLTEVEAFLAQAGLARLHQRMWRWAPRVAEVGPAQAMYEAVMRACGASGHRHQCQALARQVPWYELQQCLKSIPESARQIAAEALLLGLSGLLYTMDMTSGQLDEDTRRYGEMLHACWSQFPVELRRYALHDVAWRQPHVRPANTPERRLAGVAQLLVRYAGTNLWHAALDQCQAFRGRTDAAAARAVWRGLLALLDVPASSYWTQRTRFGGRPGRAQRLLGVQRARTVVVDAVLPLLLCVAQRDGDTALRETLVASYRAASLLPDNTLLRYMARRLLGDDPVLLALVTRAQHQQGLLQVFDDYCSNDEGECQGCEFPL